MEKMKISFLVTPSSEFQIRDEVLDYTSWVLATSTNSLKRGKRTTLTVSTRCYLQSMFNKTPFPTNEEREIMSKDTGLSYKQVTIWFQNMRRRERKRGKNITYNPQPFINQTDRYYK